MITQFLLNYLNPKSNAQVKLQMVDAMSKILEFNNDERVVLGLKPTDRVIVPGQNNSHQATVNIADKLVNFLLDDE
jgi:hypothetical protein